MGAKVSAAGVYARISSDDGTALGVGRQLADCRALAEQLGWPIVEEYVDNDVSAYSRKRRPEFERLLEDICAGRVDAVLAYHSDRLSRRPMDLERFLEVTSQAGVRHVRFAAGAEVDLTNGDGLLLIRLLGMVAANESDSKSRRVRRKMAELAAEGKPQGGTRPFGYEADKVTVRESEAEVLRAVVARFVAGESLRSLCEWLAAEGVVTPAGGPWRTTVLRNVISSPRIAGLREHNGEVVSTAVWPAIITPAERDAVLARIESRRITGRRAPRRYLLSGLLRCGRCGGKLFSAARKDTRRYVCNSGPDHGGCGSVTVTAERVEDLLTEAVLFRLDTPELADALTGRAQADAEAAGLAEEVAADRARLDELAGLYAAKEIGAREWVAARNPIQARIEGTERRLARLTNSGALAGLAGNGEALRGQWADLTLDRRHAIVAAVLDHATVAPRGPKGNFFDPARVTPVWRL